jgi:hypothetical protein
MVSIAREEIQARNPTAKVSLFGQELNPQTWAVCRSELLLLDPAGRDADNIALGSTLSLDAHPTRRFDYQFANPPYGTEWKIDRDAVMKEAERGFYGRFGAGLPRISDGQLLFLQHMLAHMNTDTPTPEPPAIRRSLRVLRTPITPPHPFASVSVSGSWATQRCLERSPAPPIRSLTSRRPVPYC